jgi:hypothetical protein
MMKVMKAKHFWTTTLTGDKPLTRARAKLIKYKDAA